MNASSLIKESLRRAGLIVVRSHHASARQLTDPPQGLFDDILFRAFRSQQKLCFLQIGANDGIRADPIRLKILRHGWRGVLVEPLPFFFEQLRKNYAGCPGLKFINAAVDAAAGRRPIYFLDPGLREVPDWSRGLASFDLARLRSAAADLGLGNQAIKEETVPTVTWDELLLELGPRPCDVLVVDAEGHDISLLRAAPLARWRPQVIHFEHACAPEAERLSFYGELIQLGYELATIAGDTIAWRMAAEPSATPR